MDYGSVNDWRYGSRYGSGQCSCENHEDMGFTGTITSSKVRSETNLHRVAAVAVGGCRIAVAVSVAAVHRCVVVWCGVWCAVWGTVDEGWEGRRVDERVEEGAGATARERKRANEGWRRVEC